MIVFQKKLLTKYDSAVTTLVFYSIGTLFTFFICAVYSTHFTINDLIFYGDHFTWIAVAYASIFATLFAYNATSYANKKLSPSITTVYNTLQPIGTVFLSFIILSTTPMLCELVGALIIAIGLIITVYERCTEEQNQFYSDYTPIFTTAVVSTEECTTIQIPLTMNMTLTNIETDSNEFVYSELIDSENVQYECSANGKVECSVQPSSPSPSPSLTLTPIASPVDYLSLGSNSNTNSSSNSSSGPGSGSSSRI